MLYRLFVSCPRKLPLWHRDRLSTCSIRGIVSKRCLQREPPLQHSVLASLRHGDLVFASEPLDLSTPLDQAIQATGDATMNWLEERGVDVARHDTAQHVGMIVEDGKGNAAYVVEAVRIAGVRVLPLHLFFKEFIPGTRFFHGKVKAVDAHQAKKAVIFAMQQASAPYADDFSPPFDKAGAHAFYCSSLVDYAYRDALSKELVFTDEPFPLTFEPESFWEEYYQKQQRKKPSGYGSNPTLLLHSQRVWYSLLCSNQVEEFHEMF
eukprot:TRINITY_DN65931_c0_g1_i1.p1 TRINITY_DN65931_c0_g1~~TRINITY_DN65931_c0_g1_i1.p1  ORF type:complete len:264 (+),score=26.15 TRINITY_DN65931_c0_g1_i1:70-861(+)